MKKVNRKKKKQGNPKPHKENKSLKSKNKKPQSTNNTAAPGERKTKRPVIKLSEIEYPPKKEVPLKKDTQPAPKEKKKTEHAPEAGTREKPPYVFNGGFSLKKGTHTAPEEKNKTEHTLEADPGKKPPHAFGAEVLLEKHIQLSAEENPGEKGETKPEPGPEASPPPRPEPKPDILKEPPYSFIARDIPRPASPLPAPESAADDTAAREGGKKTADEHAEQPVKHGKPWLVSILIFFLGISLCISAFQYVYFNSRISDIKTKAFSNAEIAKKMISERQKVLENYNPLKEKAIKLTKEVASVQSMSSALKKQNEALKTELTDTKNKLLELQQKIKQYADEVKGLVSRKIEYYTAYENEKENREQLAFTIEKLEDKIKNLNEELGSIDEEYMEKVADYVYNMAFIYAKAGMFDESIESFLRFLELNSEDADVHYNLALIYDQVKKDKNEAIKHYEEYLRLNPDAEDLYEIKMRIASLERIGVKESRPTAFKNFTINLDKLKY